MLDSGRLGRRLHSERGAVMLLTALVVAAVLAATALAVDIGSAISYKRTLQADTDLAALDAVRALHDRKGEGGMAPQAHAEKLARESLERNGFDLDAEGNVWSVTLGTLDADYNFVPGDPATATALQVELEGPLDWSFQPGGKTIRASAVAERPFVGTEGDGDGDGEDDDCSLGCAPSGGTTTTTTTVPGSTTTTTSCLVACGRTRIGQAWVQMALGSWVARLDSQKSAILNGVLSRFLGSGSNLTLDLASYQGLVAGHTTLRRLGTQLGLAAGTPDEVLDAEVNLRQLLTVTAAALTAQGDATSLAAATPMATLAAAASNSLELRLGDFISVVQGAGTAAMEAELNVFQLASMAAQVADTDHFVSLTLPVSVAGVATTTLELQVIEAPQIVIGPARQANGVWVTRATTAQIRAQLRLSLLSGVNILGVSAPVTLPVYVEGGGAEAEVRSITCAVASASQGASVWTRSQALVAKVGEATTAELTDISTSVNVTAGTLVNISILGLGLVTATGNSTIATTSTEGILNFTGPWPSQMSNNGSTTLGLSSPLKTNLNAAGGVTVNVALVAVSLRSSILAVVNPVLDVLDDKVIDPLLSAIGLSLGGADVTILSHHCRSRRLVR